MRKINSFSDELVALVKSGHQVLNVTTVEERRLLEDIHNVAANGLVEKGEAPWRVIVWDCLGGFNDTDDVEKKFAGDLVSAFMSIPTDRFNVPENLTEVVSSKPGKVTGIYNVRSEGAHV